MAFDFFGSRGEAHGEHLEDLLHEKLSIVKNRVVREKLFEVLYDNLKAVDWEWLEEEFAKWYEANKKKTLEELVSKLKGQLSGGRRRSSKRRSCGGRRRSSKRRSSRRRATRTRRYF